jgi:hypothetical protein
MSKRAAIPAFVSILLAGALSAFAAAPAAKTDSLATKQISLAAADTAKHTHFGRLSIVTTPAGAEVTVDSVPKGLCPVTVDSLTPGLHVLIVKATGYFGKKISVEIPGDSTLSLNVALVLPSHLVVVSEPAGAAAFLDDKELGLTPCDNPRLKPGEHTVKIDKTGFVSAEKRITLTEGKTDSLSVVLRQVPSSGTEKKPAPVMPKKKGFDRVAALVAVGVFVVFGVVILGVEMHEAAQ